MKQNNRDCKIVQDLLPNYIENLTDEVTNEYIEEHIATCAECAQMLKDMNGELKLEQINQDHEIKYLDGLRRRVRRTILIVALVIMMIAGCVVGYVYNKSQTQVNNYTFLRAEFIDEDEEAAKDGNIYCVMIAVIDENNICKSVRIVESGYKENVLKEKYEQIQEYSEIRNIMNAKVVDNQLHYNDNIWNGMKREELEAYWKDSYHIEKIEEI